MRNDLGTQAGASLNTPSPEAKALLSSSMVSDMLVIITNAGQLRDQSPSA